MMDFEPLRDIENASIIAEMFGEWPTFHDAEILSICLERGRGSPVLQAVIHLFSMTDYTDSDGFYSCKHHVLVNLRFHNILVYEIKWFNHQNAIDDIDMSVSKTGKRRFSIYFPSNNGCDAEFECDRIEVMSIAPYTKEERTRDRSVYARF